jgi:lipopolysaccharide heptosyltransferase I
MKNGLPRILIARLSAIGDVARILPVLNTLRDTFPNAQIDWAVEKKSADIIVEHPCLDQVLVFERPPKKWAAAKDFFWFCRQVRANRYDIVLDFHGIFKTGMLCALSGAPDRYGFHRPRAQELSNLFTNRKVHLPSPHLNRVEENLLLCDALCPQRSSLDAMIYVPYEIQDEINDFYDSLFDGGKKVVAMHVPVDRPEKQWPAGHFAQLADLLLADGRFEVMLTWGPGQFDIVQEVLNMSRRHPDVAPETPGLKHYAWLAHRADLYFGGDTGPMHIAAAMGAPVVAVFGGTDPRKHAPYRRPCEILHTDTPDSTPAERLRQITPEMAYDACIRLIS